MVISPIGVDSDPYFGWKMISDKEGEKQKSYKITVAADKDFSDIVWDSGKVDSDVSNGIEYSGKPLSNMTVYYWRTEVEDASGETVVSDVATFETGLSAQKSWDGCEWIKVAGKTRGRANALQLTPKLIKIYEKIRNGGKAEDYSEKISALYKKLGSSNFRKQFKADNKEIVSARLYTTSLGVHDFYINGKRVGNKSDDGSMTYDELKPGFTQVFERALYYTYDVKSYIGSGKNNTLSATVTEGWFRDEIVSCKGKESALLAKLVIRYADGTEQVIPTDTSWKASRGGPVIAASIYSGEVYDANADVSFRKNGFDDSSWKNAVKSDEFYGTISTAETGAKIRIKPDAERRVKSTVVYSKTSGASRGKFGNIVPDDVIKGNKSFTLKAGQKAVVDFGQNAAGWEKFTVSGKKGTAVVVRHGEMINEKDGIKERGNDGAGGSLYTANLRGISAATVYVMSGDKKETFNPSYSFFGFRYIEITATDDITVHSITAQTVTSALIRTGTLETSDKDVNKLISNFFFGQYSNYLSVPTDCPQRNERLGWTADTQVFSTTGCLNMDSYAFFRKWLQDMRDSQDKNGAYPDVAPYGVFFHSGNLGWTDAGMIVPYNLYKIYGMKEIIATHYESMKKFMDVFMASTNKDGAGLAYGDWLSYEPNDDGLKRLIGIAYYAWDALMMADMAALLGKDDDVKKYKAVYEDEKEYFISRYFNSDGTIKRKEQTACLMTLKMKLYPDENARKTVLKMLTDNIKAHGGRLQTGFLGAAVLLEVLSDEGESDVAFDLLLQHEDPSWLYSVDQGATTIWERWNSYTIKDGFGDVGMNSFNHYAYGSVGEWIYSYMAGLRTSFTDGGFKHFTLQPLTNARFDFIKCSFDSAYGVIKSAWEKNGEGFKYYITVPANTSCTVILPENKLGDVKGKINSEPKLENGNIVFELNAGTYVF